MFEAGEKSLGPVRTAVLASVGCSIVKPIAVLGVFMSSVPASKTQRQLILTFRDGGSMFQFTSRDRLALPERVGPPEHTDVRREFLFIFQTKYLTIFSFFFKTL